MLSVKETYRLQAVGHTSTSQNCPLILTEKKQILNKTMGLDPKKFKVILASM